jgi:hypothetical protein
VLGVLLAQTLELGVAVLDVGDETLDEAAVLDVLEDVLHALLGVGVDDPRAGHVATELRGVGHRVVHPGDATFVDQVDDELELVQHLEIGHLRGVTGLDHDLETGLDELLGATAQHGLLTEQVGLGLFLERGLDDTGAGTTDGGGVGERQRLTLPLGVLRDGDQRGHALAVDELPAHQVAGALGGDHADGDVLGRLDQSEVDVQAVPEEQRVAILQVGLDVVGEDLGLRGVRCEHHDHIGPLGDLGRRSDLQTLLFDLDAGLRALFEADLDLYARVTQRQRMGMALAAVADHRDLAALDDRQIRVVVVEQFDCH